jgi:hypothetical protein
MYYILDLSTNRITNCEDSEVKSFLFRNKWFYAYGLVIFRKSPFSHTRKEKIGSTYIIFECLVCNAKV